MRPYRASTTIWFGRFKVTKFERLHGTSRSQEAQDVWKRRRGPVPPQRVSQRPHCTSTRYGATLQHLWEPPRGFTWPQQAPLSQEKGRRGLADSLRATVGPCPASVCLAEAHPCIHKAEGGPAVPLLVSVRLFLASIPGSMDLIVAWLSLIEARGGSAASATVAPPASVCLAKAPHRASTKYGVPAPCLWGPLRGSPGPDGS